MRSIEIWGYVGILTYRHIFPMALADTAVRNAKLSPKAAKLAKEKSYFSLLRLLEKYWQQKCRFNGREKLLAHGVYPDVTIKEARERRDTARKLLANGIGPDKMKNHRVQQRFFLRFFLPYDGKLSAFFNGPLAEAVFLNPLGAISTYFFGFSASEALIFFSQASPFFSM